MPTLPRMSGREAVRVFEKLGWEVGRRKGSHIVMTKERHIATLSIPDRREVAKGTLRSLLRSAEITGEEFLEAYRNL